MFVSSFRIFLKILFILLYEGMPDKQVMYRGSQHFDTNIIYKVALRVHTVLYIYIYMFGRKYKEIFHFFLLYLECIYCRGF